VTRKQRSAEIRRERQANQARALGETYNGLNASATVRMDLPQPIAVLGYLQIHGQPADQPWARGSQCGRSINNCQFESLSQVYCTSYLREVIDDLVGTLQSQLALLLEATGGVDSDGQVLAVVLSLSEILNVLKITK
jgi:hypothetical protein